MRRTTQVDSVAEAYLELLAARGIKYFFGNGGTDFGPIVDAYAKRLSTEAPVPTPVTVPHEIVAVAMAHGYTVVTGEPQVVMVHTVAGTANATGGLINANRAGVPMLFSAGRTPLTEGDARGSRDGGIHWAQESFDQGAMVREWVKWDYELRHGSDVEGLVDRALAISTTEPRGPVYLTLPREVLAEAQVALTYDTRPRMTASEFVPTSEKLEEAARALAGARQPLLVTRSGGKDPASVAQLVRLAEAVSLPIFEVGATHVNFPHSHRLHQAEPVTRYLPAADVIVVLESDAPWAPKHVQLDPNVTVIGIGADPLFARYPVRGFPVSIGLAGNIPQTLSALADTIARQPLDREVSKERGDRWADNHKRVRAANAARGLSGKDKAPLDKAWFSLCLEQLRDDGMIIVNELGLDATQFEVDEPGSYFAVSSAGVLGWAVGAALGVKLAAHDKTVVACIGDGSYMFGVPEAAHWVARRYDLPVLYIVWNNARWAAVANATRGVYPEGWAVKTASFPFSDLAPALDFEKGVQAAGGYGEKVTSPDQVAGALQRGLHAVQVEKRVAVLNVIA